MLKLYPPPDSSQPPDDALCADYFLAGVLGRALEEIDGDYRYRSGHHVPHTRAQMHEQRVVNALQRELNRITRRYTAPPFKHYAALWLPSRTHEQR